MNIDSNGKNENENEFVEEENNSEKMTSGTVSDETLETVETTEISEETVVEDESAEMENVVAEPLADEAVADDYASVDEPTPAVKTAAAAGAKAPSALPKLLALLGIFILLGVGLVLWKNKTGGHSSSEDITKKDMELILADMNPMMLRQLSQNPEAKKELAGNVRELFAIASQAEKDGAANDANVKRELDNIDYEILAVSYDKAINKEKGPMPPFGFISEDQVNQFWNGEGGDRTFMDGIGMGSNNAKSREAAFQRFLDAKIALAKESGGIPADREISEDEIKQAKDYYAKSRIYYAEAMSKKGVKENGLPEDFFEKVELQTKLQKAQFLARRYATKQLAEKVKVTDEDVDKYLAEHPELGSKEAKQAKAEEILAKVKNGGDFAALAKEFSDDPGSKDKGGLYENITEGAFVPEFEKAAFSMKPGEIYPELVPTNFGYHIIKLEKLGETKASDGTVKRTFDARHILISTMYKDPENPAAREVPVKDFVKSKLEKEKEEKVLEEIKANNPIEVAEDFDIPTPPAGEQPQLPPGMMPQQMPPDMPPGAQVDDEDSKPAPKNAPKAPAAPPKPAQPKK
ncbi:MAG: peptidylprolyl isomerase [Pyrinomonadaceae bacterium]